MRNNCQTASGFLKASVVLLLLAIILHVIGFATPFWSEGGGDNEGLWEVCVLGFCTDSGNSLLGETSFFQAVQAFMILSLIFAVLTLILTFVALCIPRLTKCLPLLISLLVSSFVTGLFILIAVTVYGVRAQIYIEGTLARQFEFGFSFILTAISLFGFFIVALIVAWDINNIVEERKEEEEEAEKDAEKGEDNSDDKDEDTSDDKGEDNSDDKAEDADDSTSIAEAPDSDDVEVPDKPETPEAEY